MSSAIWELNPFNGSSGPGKFHPVEHRRQVHISPRCRLHCAPNRRPGEKEIVDPGETGPLRRTTQLCQVGTPTGNCPIKIQLPETEAATEIEDGHTQTSIWWHESAPSP